MFLSDIAAIVFGALPLIAWLGLWLSFTAYSQWEDDTVFQAFFNEYAMAFVCAFLSLIILSIASSIYNFIGTLNRRITGCIGIFINIISIALWVIIPF
jgi:hypothetical protein